MSWQSARREMEERGKEKGISNKASRPSVRTLTNLPFVVAFKNTQQRYISYININVQFLHNGIGASIFLVKN
jgi:hypothetical protein